MSREIEIANIKEAMNGADNKKMITPYSLNQVIKRKGGSGSGTPGVGLNYYWNGTELGVKREDEENYTFVDLQGPAGSDGSDGEDGAPGAPGTNGTNGVDGADGKEIELQVTATYIQWRYVGDINWINLIALSSLKGADGTNGTNGVDGEDGQGVPVGGTIGQVLKKKSATDFDTEWGAAADPNAILWTNDRPTSSYTSLSLTISESIANYDSYEVIYRGWGTNPHAFSTGIIPKSFGTMLSYFENSNLMFNREIAPISGTTVTFGNSTGAYCIPLYIIGHKTGLF